MEETKWLTKGKIIVIVAILLIIGGVVTFIFIHRNNLKKDYIKFENQLEYAAPNYLLKEKITLMEDEWREISIKDIMSQKLIINKRASDCEGYIIAEAHKNIEDTKDEEEKDKNESVSKTNTSTDLNKEENREKTDKKVSNNITYQAYVSCKNIYKTPGYGTKPTDKEKNDKETQTENDTEKPILELFGDEEIKITVGDEYNELGAVATDNIDGDITSKIKITGKVDTSKEGKYTLKYTVSDSSKNKATKTRVIIVEAKKVEEKPEEKPTEEPGKPSTQEPQTPVEPQKPVVDTTKPVIIFNDDSLYQTICTGNKVNTSVNGAYGYIARDDVDGNITGRVKITGDTGVISKPGIYNLHYEVVDNAGNKANASKQFTVKSCSSTIPSTDVKVPISSIGITPTRVSMAINQNIKLSVTIYPSNADDKTIRFETLNSSIAKVSSDGTITAVSKGKTRIKVYSSNGKVAWCDVTVN